MSPSSSHRLAGAVVMAFDVTMLRFGWVPPSELRAHLAHPRGWVDAVGTDGASLELARVGLWLAAVWLALAVVAVLASVLPGTLGRMGNGVADRAVPAVVRRTIVAALGASVVLVPVAAGASTTAGHSAATARRSAAAASQIAAASVSPGPSGAGATRLSGDWPWPTSAPTAATPVPAASAPAKPVPWPHSTPTRSAPGPSSRDVVVEAGDCLWVIAARRLGPHASAHRIATETERWYQANATTIGADPGLIQPGQHLHHPTEKGR